jgi:hypothetical protein
MLRVLAPPPLPVNVEGEVKTLHDVLDHGGMLLIDYVRGLQRLGVLPSDVDPEEYAGELEAEREAESARTQATMAATFGPGQPPAEPDEEPEPEDEELPPDGAE